MFTVTGGQGNDNPVISPTTSEIVPLRDLYQCIVLKACEDAAFGQAGGQHIKDTFFYLKDDKLGECCGQPGIIARSRVNPDSLTLRKLLKQVIPDPDLQHPVSQRVIGEFVHYYSLQNSFATDSLPYKSTASLLSSYRSKILLETLQYAYDIPTSVQHNAENRTVEQLAASFIRSTGDGPLDDSEWKGDHYIWAGQYAAAKKLCGAGKCESAISFREEMKKPQEAMHSSATISLNIVTSKTLSEEPVLRKMLYTLGWAWVSDSDWEEAKHFEWNSNDIHSRNIQHVLLGHQAQNASLGYEKLCETQRQEKGTLIRPAWLCHLTPEERQRLLLAQCYADFHVNCESDQDLIEEEGLRSRCRLGNAVFGSMGDSYDEWVNGEANNGASLCSDCLSTELKRTLSLEFWNSDDYSFIDRWQYSAVLYFYFSTRHNLTLARFVHFFPELIDDILAQYNQAPLSTLKSNKSLELMAKITSVLGLSLQEHDEVADRIARSFDWASISGLCDCCIQDGAVDEWYIATFGASLAARNLPLPEKARLATYLDTTGWNVFPRLFRSYSIRCGCVGRWSKRLHMLSTQASALYTAQQCSSVFAVRSALAGSFGGLNDEGIAKLLRGVNKEIQLGRQLGQQYRAMREQEICNAKKVKGSCWLDINSPVDYCQVCST
ncbi:hypothetical protein BGW38_001875 [Lunasporangiospora selenospora]|uniref:Uncharacterized protein n=1 Tax=Lunasporangiospora selenospora TaxID=979761 RepID=A0A9P6KDU3_9FUNG|nr:hypothetical protein BGW38_001875 [Lunasporangiospora selenospora]